MACMIIPSVDSKLPLPNPTNVEEIFGPDLKPTFDCPYIDEGACTCHVFQTELSSYLRLSKVYVGNGKFDKIRTPDITQDHSHSIIGHRGAGLNAPENSLSAIRKCAKRGCKMVEFDVCLTKDFVPVLFHDDNLLRITGVDRRISEINWEELRMIDISDKFPGERVPTLEEAVETCLSLGLRFIIDIKDENEKLIDSIISIFRKYKKEAYSKGVVSSFYFRVIYKIRSRDSNIVASMAWRPLFFALPPAIKSSDSTLTKLRKRFLVNVMYFWNDFAMKYIFWWMIGLSAILVHKDALNMELVQTLRKRNLRVYTWTVNCPVEKQFLLNKLQVGYLTDTLDSEDCTLEAAERWLCNNNVC